MASPSPSMQHLLLTVVRALDREQDLWTPCMPVDSQSEVARLRPRAIAWLGKLNDKFGFSAETLFLAVDIFDRFLQRVRVQVKYVKCITVTCFYLAAKSVEEDDVIPGTCELVRLTECGCSTAEVLRMELCILDKLDWTLHASQTSLEFTQLFNALVLTKCPSVAAATHGTSLQPLTAILLYCLPHAPLLAHSPSALSLAVLSLYLERTWIHWVPAVQTLQDLAQLSKEDLLDCRDLIIRCLGTQRIDALHMMSTGVVNTFSPCNNQATRAPLHPISTTPTFNSSSAVGTGTLQTKKVGWNRTKVAPPPSMPVTPHPPAKRRRVEQDDDVYDDIRSLYDSDVAYGGGAMSKLGLCATSSGGVTMSSCAGQVTRFAGVVASQVIAAG